MNTRVFLSVFLVAVDSCAGFDGSSLPPCAQGTIATVTTDAAPVFAWTPDCRIDQIVVTNVLDPSAGPNQVQWSAATLSVGRGVAAPIRYGQPPAPMETEYGPTPLVHGQQYAVLLMVRGVVVVGPAYFVP